MVFGWRASKQVHLGLCRTKSSGITIFRCILRQRQVWESVFGQLLAGKLWLSSGGPQFCLLPYQTWTSITILFCLGIVYLNQKKCKSEIDKKQPKSLYFNLELVSYFFCSVIYPSHIWVLRCRRYSINKPIPLAPGLLKSAAQGEGHT